MRWSPSPGGAAPYPVGSTPAARSPPCLHERPLVLHGLRKESGVNRAPSLAALDRDLAYFLRDLWREHVEDALVDGRALGDGDFVDDERGRHCDAVVDHVAERRLNLRPVHVEVGVRVPEPGRTLVGSLVRRVLAVREQAVLEVVDAEGDGFPITDGTEVGRDLDTVFVRFFDRGAELRP